MATNQKGVEYENLSALRDNVYPALASLGYVKIEDPKILLHKFPELADFLEIDKIPFFGHLGVGIIHPVYQLGDDEKIKRMYKYVRRLQGQVTGEHGIGLAKKEFLETTEKKIISRIKTRHDPFCKINCNKIIDAQVEIVPEKVEEEKVEEGEEKEKQSEEEENG